MSPEKYSPRPVEIIDTTLREGLQSPIWDDVGRFYPSDAHKLDIGCGLMKYGIRHIETFAPNVGEDEERGLVILDHGARRMYVDLTGKPVYLLAHVRCHPRDVEEAIRAGANGLNFYIGTSNESQQFSHGKKLDEIINIASPLIEDVRRNHPDLLLRFSGEDAFRTPINDLFTVYDAVEGSVDRLGTPDTVGTATPVKVIERVRALRDRYPHIPLEGHFHNDRGYAMVNSMVAIQEGMQFIQSTILGIGERSGITSTTGLLFNLYLENPELLVDYDLSSSYALNVLFSQILGIQVPTTEPVSLTNRTHSAGVHTAAVLKGSSAYEAHPLQDFGVSEQKLLLGPLSGRHIIHYYLTHVMNFIDVTEELAKEITERFKTEIGSAMKKGKTPKQLLSEIAQGMRLARVEKPASHQEVLT